MLHIILNIHNCYTFAPVKQRRRHTYTHLRVHTRRRMRRTHARIAVSPVFMYISIIELMTERLFYTCANTTHPNTHIHPSPSHRCSDVYNIVRGVIVYTENIFRFDSVVFRNRMPFYI